MYMYTYTHIYIYMHTYIHIYVLIYFNEICILLLLKFYELLKIFEK